MQLAGKEVWQMDNIDLVILKFLQDNGRDTASNISKKIHLSVSAVLDRIHKLEESGVVKKYTVLLDSRKLGYDVLAVMEVRLEHPRFYDSFVEAVMGNDSIVDCYYLTGDFDFNLKICCKSSEDLEAQHRFVKEIPGVSATITHYVLKEVKNIYEVTPGVVD